MALLVSSNYDNRVLRDVEREQHFKFVANLSFILFERKNYIFVSVSSSAYTLNSKRDKRYLHEGTSNLSEQIISD